MAAKLSSWERAQRQAERESERRRVADHRRVERALARQERAAERAQLRSEQSRERARVQEEREEQARRKEQAHQNQINNWRKQVAAFDAYLEGLVSFHRQSFALDEWRSRALQREEMREFPKNAFARATLPAREYGTRPYPGVGYPTSASRGAARHGIFVSSLVLAVLVALVLMIASPTNKPLWVMLLGMIWVGVALFFALRGRWQFRRADRERRRLHEGEETARLQTFRGCEIEGQRLFDDLETQRRFDFDAEEVSLREQVRVLEERRTEVLEDARNGSPEALALLCEAILPFDPSLDVPDGLTSSMIADYEIGVVARPNLSVALVIRLPELGVIPTKTMSMTPSGEKIRFKELADRARIETFDRYVASFSVRCALEVLKHAPFLEEVFVEAGLPGYDPATGLPKDNVLFQVGFQSSKLKEIDLIRVEAVEFVKSIGGIVHSVGKGESSIVPKVDRALVQWAELDDVDEVVLLKPELPSLQRWNAFATLDGERARAVHHRVWKVNDDQFRDNHPEQTEDTGVAQKAPSKSAVALGVITWIGGMVASFASAGAEEDSQHVVVASIPAPSIVVSKTPEGMVRIPAGGFFMGSDEGRIGEKPRRSVEVNRDFYIDKLEVTAGDYQSCVTAKKCTSPSLHGPAVTQATARQMAALCTSFDPAKVNYPVNCVDRQQAAGYCAFREKRLPTDIEWEYAARGRDGNKYPWGAVSSGCDQAIVGGCQKGPAPVGSRPSGASPFGLLDVSGNVWEWVADDWGPNAAAPTIPLGVLRGGSWDFSLQYGTTWSRLKFSSQTGHVSTGIRCAKSI